MPFTDSFEGQTFSCYHTSDGSICDKCLGKKETPRLPKGFGQTKPVCICGNEHEVFNYVFYKQKLTELIVKMESMDEQGCRHLLKEEWLKLPVEVERDKKLEELLKD